MTTQQKAEELAEKCANDILGSSRIQNLNPSASRSTRDVLKHIILTDLNLAELLESKKQFDQLKLLTASIEPCGTTAQAMCYMSLLFKYEELEKQNAELSEDRFRLLEALRCANNSFFGSPGGQKQIDDAIAKALAINAAMKK